jgi:hypothetical protein
MRAEGREAARSLYAALKLTANGWRYVRRNV